MTAKLDVFLVIAGIQDDNALAFETVDERENAVKLYFLGGKGGEQNIFLIQLCRLGRGEWGNHHTVSLFLAAIDGLVFLVETKDIHGTLTVKRSLGGAESHPKMLGSKRKGEEQGVYANEGKAYVYRN